MYENWVSSLVPHLAEKLEAEEEEQNKKKKKLDDCNRRERNPLDRKMKKYDSPLHIVSAQIGELGLTLAQETVQSKSNEIPAVQELIKTLEIERCMVVADALNCQIQTAQAIIDAKADYLLSAKGNQKELMNDIAAYVQDENYVQRWIALPKRKKGTDG